MFRSFDIFSYSDIKFRVGVAYLHCRLHSTIICLDETVPCASSPSCGSLVTSLEVPSPSKLFFIAF